MTLDITFCTNKECTQECAYKLTDDIEQRAKELCHPLSVCERRCKVEVKE